MVLMVSLCGFVVSFWLVKLVWRALVIEFFLVVLGGFLGGYCTSAIVERYHLSGFFVWVVYTLCIFFGMGLVFEIYEKLVEYKYHVIGAIVGIMGISGAVFGGGCADIIREYYHLSGSFVWVVYTLCILLGAGICGPFYYFWSKWLAKWLPKKFLESKNKYGINKYGSVVVVTVMAIIWELVTAMGILGVMVGGALLYTRYILWL
ncbi:hypothetical protein HG560_05745 [Helicobacter pylori]|uniref:Uncharacterized protein n=1 Tax=Helicobacter pylori TaxID=210 RepID=A0AAE7P5R9_HELPX|nr:hypothetical protein [Helicobacter pylori]AFI01365.1 hypothetical protein HPSH112_05880 [Helicobacter pylori Shi112]QQW94000.1 hypothetical protein HG560_05745 [Helicobacter pylori]QQX49969.1 hypothetical protein HG562_05760 [Helicobacter pylori]